MGTGRIVNLNQPQPSEPLTRLQQSNAAPRVEVLNKEGGGPPQPVEVRLHEQVIVEDEGNIRRKKKDGSPDLRFRSTPSSPEWEKIKRGDWEAK